MPEEGVAELMALEIAVVRAFSCSVRPVSALFILATEVTNPEQSVVVPEACARHKARMLLANHVTICRISRLFVPASVWNALLGVAEAMALVSNVTKVDSTEVRPVSTVIWLENCVAIVDVDKPEAELHAVSREATAPATLLLSMPNAKPLWTGVEGVTLLRPVDTWVSILLSQADSVVSADCWEAIEAANVAVETPVAEV